MIRFVMCSFVLFCLIQGCSHAPKPFNKLGYSDSTSLKTREAIRDVIQEPTHNKELWKCYDKLLKKNPQAEGKIVLQWSIDPLADGKVTEIKRMSGSDEMSEVSDCLMAQIKTWKFRGLDAKENSEKIIEVSYPFSFMQQKN